MHLFCGVECETNFCIRANSGAMRRALFKLERGVCQTCRLDCHALITRIRYVTCLNGWWTPGTCSICSPGWWRAQPLPAGLPCPNHLHQVCHMPGWVVDLWILQHSGGPVQAGLPYPGGLHQARCMHHPTIYPGACSTCSPVAATAMGWTRDFLQGFAHACSLSHLSLQRHSPGLRSNASSCGFTCGPLTGWTVVAESQRHRSPCMFTFADLAAGHAALSEFWRVVRTL